jgi:DNA replicative helicase MCM subunit Mcm2 (Cdc46/Mcm family)
MASARVRLGDRITIDDIDRGLEIIGASLGQVGLTKDGAPTQDPERAKRMNNTLDKKQKENLIVEAANGCDVDEIAEDTGLTPEEVDHLITKRKGLKDQGRIYKPPNEGYKST